ncbi:hypothetical protein AA103581_1972 [Gluconobacter wancherniae NBRC 103581]|nr:hypothetical protein AA103581_1972 [Gluconobacter wancherniae NBRC 103581]
MAIWRQCQAGWGADNACRDINICHYAPQAISTSRQRAEAVMQHRPWQHLNTVLKKCMAVIGGDNCLRNSRRADHQQARQGQTGKKQNPQWAHVEALPFFRTFQCGQNAHTCLNRTNKLPVTKEHSLVR